MSKQEIRAGEDGTVWPPAVEHPPVAIVEPPKPERRLVSAVLGLVSGFLLTTFGLLFWGWAIAGGCFLYYRTKNPYFAWGDFIGSAIGWYVFYYELSHHCFMCG